MEYTQSHILIKCFIEHITENRKKHTLTHTHRVSGGRAFRIQIAWNAMYTRYSRSTQANHREIDLRKHKHTHTHRQSTRP